MQFPKVLTATSLLSLILFGGKAAQAQQQLSSEQITASETRNNITLTTSEASCQRLPEQQEAFDEALDNAESMTSIAPDAAPLFGSAALLDPFCYAGGDSGFPGLINTNPPNYGDIEADINRGFEIYFFSPCGNKFSDPSLVCIEFG